MKNLVSLCLLLPLASGLCAKPVELPPSSPGQEHVSRHEALPAGTPIMLEMMQTVTTEGDSWQQGDTFSLKVSEDVVLDDYVVIPRGTLAFGHVRWSTGRGAFGKSGKIEVEIDHLILGGKEVRLTGIHRQIGSGGLKSPGSVVAAGLLVPFITGKSGEFAQGSAMQAFLAEDLRVLITSQRPLPVARGSSVPVVRARQISVAEAFGNEVPAQSGNARSELRMRRQSVSEAFAKEISSLQKPR
jgi:hypothetical protein